MSLSVSTSVLAAAPTPLVERRSGPAGSLILVEPEPALPLVRVIVALRSGSAWDPRKKDGLANLVGETARHGAAHRSRTDLDRQLDALGAVIDVQTDADSLRFEGHVLTKHLDAFLGILADIVLRPDFAPAEIDRTRQEILASVDEDRNDDQQLCARYFARNLYAEHPYGHAPDGDRASLERITAGDLSAFHKRHVVGSNLIFAAYGDVTPTDFATRVGRAFSSTPKGATPGANPLTTRDPVPPQGWRISIVDKPDREQVQIMFGNIALPAQHADFVPLMVAISSFGGHGMTATLMDEVRTKRGLSYGAYMSLSQRFGRAATVGWVSSAKNKAITTLKLVLRLYVALMEKGLSDRKVALAKTFLSGTLGAEMDEPEHRLDARVTAEITGLPATFVDDLPSRVRAVTTDQVNAAIKRHVHARDLAITVVATASEFRKRLLESKVAPSAIDVVPFDDY